MVEQGRSPSPEDRKPIQEWEVKAIPDAVESWYKQGASAPLSPPVAEQHEISEHGNQSPVTAFETAALIEAAEQIVRGGASDEAQEQHIDDTVRALRAEDRILKFYAETYPDSAVNAAEQLRADPLGFGLINHSVHLHPNDAESPASKQASFSFHDKLVYHVNEAMQEGREFTRDDMLAMYERQKNREGEFKDYSDKYEAYSVEHGMGSFDFSMENVFAASERHVLAGHLQKDEKERVNIMQPAVVAVHELIENALPQPQPVPVPNE